MPELRNLTPHPIVLRSADRVWTWPEAETAHRLTSRVVSIGSFDLDDVSVPLVALCTDDVTPLPPAEAGVYFIVSRSSAEAHPERDDLVFPWPVVTDDDGLPQWCEGFGRVTTGGPMS